MARHSIAIDADVSGVKKQLTDLSNILDTKLKKSTGLKVFDQKSMDTVFKEAERHLDRSKRSVERMGRGIDRYQKVLEKGNISAKQREATEKKVTELMAKQAKHMINIERTQKQMNNIRSRGGMMGGLGRMGQGMGMGRGLGMMGGLGKMGMLGMGAGAVLGLGAFAVGRGAAAMQTYKGGIDSRLAMRGRGFGRGDVMGADPRLQQLGIGPEQFRGLSMQAVDVFGRKGADKQAVGERAEFERMFGMELGTLTQAGAGLRQNLGGEGAQKALAKIQANMMAQELEGAVGPYLQTMSQMLTEMNESGMTFDQSAIDMFTRLSQGQGMGPERAARILGNMNERIAGSSGEQNTFFQAAFAGRGLGANTFGGAQEAVAQGMFGYDAGKLMDMGLNERDVEVFRNMNLVGKGVAQEKAGGIVDLINAQGFDANSDQGRFARGQFTAQQFGLNTAAEGMQYFNLLNQLQTSEDPKKQEEIRKKMNEMTMSPEQKNAKRLEDLLATGDAQLKALEAIKEVQQQDLGARLVPIAAGIEKLLVGIDKALSYALGFLGFDTPQEDRIEKIEDAEKLSAQDVGRMASVDELKEMEAAAKKQLEEEKRMLDIRKSAGYSRSGIVNQSAVKKQQEEVDVTQQNLQLIQQKLLERQTEAAERTARQTDIANKINKMNSGAESKQRPTTKSKRGAN